MEKLELNQIKTINKSQSFPLWEDWALTESRPSKGLRNLRETGMLELFPELKNLIGNLDRWEHTLQAVDRAAEISNRDGLEGQERVALMMAALCHDLGSSDPDVDTVRRFLVSIGTPPDIRKMVTALVAQHENYTQEATPQFVRTLAWKIRPLSLATFARLVEADVGHVPVEVKNLLSIARAMDISERGVEPIINQEHFFMLANDGYLPPMYKRHGLHHLDLEDLVFKMQLEGLFDNEYEGLQYVKRLFSVDYQNAVLALGALSDKEKDKLIEYLKTSGMEIEEILDRGERFVREVSSVGV